jgi:hypothetical protein
LCGWIYESTISIKESQQPSTCSKTSKCPSAVRIFGHCPASFCLVFICCPFWNQQ